VSASRRVAGALGAVGVVVGAALATSAWATPRAGHAATGVIVEGHRVTERDDLGAIVRDRATR
jgi:hypothetical protein